MTHTYDILEVSKSTYDEISDKLGKNGYHDAFISDGRYGIVIDMQGLALAKDQKEKS